MENSLAAGIGKLKARLGEFVEEHQDDPEYLLAWSLMHHGSVPENSRTWEAISNIKKAEDLDPENPIYPFWLGIIYSDACLNLRIYDPDPEKALAAFDRAGKLDPDNAAIDLAKLHVQVEYPGNPAYFQRYEGLYSYLEPSPRLEGAFLTPEGKLTLQKALTKKRYQAYSSDAVAMGFKLLKDSNRDNFYTRREIIGSISTVSFKPPTTPISLYIKDMVSVSNEAEVAQIVDTLTQILNLGFMIRNDISGVLYDSNAGYYLVNYILSMLGDLFLINEMRTEEKLVGNFIVQNRLWYRLWLIRHGWIQPMGFDYVDVACIISGNLGSLILILVTILFLVTFVGTLLTKPCKDFIKLGFARSWVFLIPVLTVLLILFTIWMVHLMEEVDATMTIWLLLLLFPLIGAALTIYRVFIKHEKSAYQFIVPVFIFVFGLVPFIVGGLTYFELQLALVFLIIVFIPIPVILGAIMGTKDCTNKWSAFWRGTTRVSAEVIVVFALLLLIAWGVVGPHLTEFMNIEKYNMFTPLTGKGGGWNEWEPDQPHFFPNDGTIPAAHLKRLETLEKMFDKDFSPGE